MNRPKILIGATAALAALGISTLAFAAPADKITICHAAGLAGTTHYVELTISENAVFGPGGHFNENGTTQAGHEQDYMGPCNEPATATPTSTSSPTSTATASPTNTASPTATGTVPTSTSTATGTATSTPTSTATPTITNTPVTPNIFVVPPVIVVTATPTRTPVTSSVPSAAPVLPRSLPATGNGGYLD